MAVGLSSGIADDILDALLNNTAWSQPATVYAQLHTGDPGAAGTSNIATETTRKAVSFGSSSGGSCSSDADTSWTSVAGSEDYTHYSLWDAATDGNFLESGTVTANAVTAGDTFTIASGDITLTLSVAS